MGNRRPKHQRRTVLREANAPAAEESEEEAAVGSSSQGDSSLPVVAASAESCIVEPNASPSPNVEEETVAPLPTAGEDACPPRSDDPQTVVDDPYTIPSDNEFDAPLAAALSTGQSPEGATVERCASSSCTLTTGEDSRSTSQLQHPTFVVSRSRSQERKLGSTNSISNSVILGVLKALHSASQPSEMKLGPRTRQPRFMAPLQRQSPPRQSSEDDTDPPAPESVLVRRAFVFPTLLEFEVREQAGRSKIVTRESSERQDIFETFSFRLADLRISIAKRDAYVSSEAYRKSCDRGRERRTRTERLLASQLSEGEDRVNCTFEPKISRYASLRPQRTTEAFIAASQEWVETVKKRRRAASAQVLREEQVTFAPELSAASKEIVKRLEKESRHTHIVEGWAQRLEEHKMRMRELEEKYAYPFAPQIENRRLVESRGAERSASPRRAVSEKAVVSRLYDVALEHRKVQARKLEAKMKSETTSPPQVKRSASAIREHLQRMQELEERHRVKIESKRAKAEKESVEREQSSHRPHLSATSAALAELHRQRLSATGSSNPPVTVHEHLYKNHTAATECRQRSTSTERVLCQPLRRGKGLERQASTAASSPPAKSVERHAASSREFHLRNEKLLQERSMHVREIKHVLEEREAAECTFAPQLSVNTARIARSRRSSQPLHSESRGATTQYGTLGENDWDSPHLDVLTAYQPQQQSTAQRYERPPLPTKQHHDPTSTPRGHDVGSPEPSGDPNASPRRFGEIHYYRTDANGVALDGRPPRRMSNSDSERQNSSRSVQERLDDIEGMLQQWRWLEGQTSSSVGHTKSPK